VTGTRSVAVGPKWRHNRNGKYATLHKFNLAVECEGTECFGGLSTIKKTTIACIAGASK